MDRERVFLCIIYFFIQFTSYFSFHLSIQNGCKQCPHPTSNIKIWYKSSVKLYVLANTPKDYFNESPRIEWLHTYVYDIQNSRLNMISQKLQIKCWESLQAPSEKHLMVLRTPLLILWNRDTLPSTLIRDKNLYLL